MDTASSSYSRVLHIGDSARTSTYLVQAAREKGMQWRVQPFAASKIISNPVLAVADKALRGIVWEARLMRKRALVNFVHLHNAMALPHVNWLLGKQYALHLHGSEIRTSYFDPRYQSRIKKAVENASVVFFSTPDLKQLVLPLRADARYCPVPVAIPASQATQGRHPELMRSGIIGKYIFFPSRWSAAKGGKAQLELVRELRILLPSEVTLVGLDWGENAAAARAAGVRLVQKQEHKGFLQLIQHAALNVGQQTGVMGASELEALALNVPLAMPLNPDWYDGSHPALNNVPVVGSNLIGAANRRELGQLIVANLENSENSCNKKTDTAQWVKAQHSPEAAFETVIDGYMKAK